MAQGSNPSASTLLLLRADYSRPFLRNPCVGVHPSMTSIQAFSSRWVCTTSAISARNRSPSAPFVSGRIRIARQRSSPRPATWLPRPRPGRSWRSAARTVDPVGDLHPCERWPSTRTPVRRPRRAPRSRRFVVTHQLARWPSSCAGARRIVPARIARILAARARRLSTRPYGFLSVNHQVGWGRRGPGHREVTERLQPEVNRTGQRTCRRAGITWIGPHRRGHCR